MKMFFFGNMYLSSIQQGIQAAHAVNDMWVRVIKNARSGKTVSLDNLYLKSLYDFCTDEKTMVLLNGGDNTRMEHILSMLDASSYLYSFFYEEGIGGVLSSICVLLPEKMYNDVSKQAFQLGKEKMKKLGYTDWEYKFLLEKNDCPLAR